MWVLLKNYINNSWTFAKDTMDAFEAVVAMLLRREGYWVIPSFKVDLTKDEKRAIKRHSSPRWEIDLAAYKGATNELIAIECKSFLDSIGVVFKEAPYSLQRGINYSLNRPLEMLFSNVLVNNLLRHNRVVPSQLFVLRLLLVKLRKKQTEIKCVLILRLKIGFYMTIIGFNLGFVLYKTLDMRTTLPMWRQNLRFVAIEKDEKIAIQWWKKTK